MDDQNIFEIDPTVFQDSDPELGFDPVFGFSGPNQNILPDPELLARIRNWTLPVGGSQLGRRTLPFGIVSAVREELAFAQSFFDGARAETVRAFRDPTRRAPRFRYWPDRSGLVPVQFGVSTTYVDEVHVEEFFPTFAPTTEDGVFDEVRGVDPLHPLGLIPRSVPSEATARTAQSEDSIRLRELVLLGVLQVREDNNFSSVPEAWDQAVSRVEATRILIREDIETVWNLQFGGRVNVADLLYVDQEVVFSFIGSNLRFAHL